MCVFTLRLILLLLANWLWLGARNLLGDDCAVVIGPAVDDLLGGGLNDGGIRLDDDFLGGGSSWRCWWCRHRGGRLLRRLLQTESHVGGVVMVRLLVRLLASSWR